MSNVQDHIVGRARITHIPELVASFDGAVLLPGWSPAVQAGLTADEIRTGRLELSVHSWLLRHGNDVVLIDAGVGNGKPRSVPAFNALRTPFLDVLGAAGIAPEDVTHVLLTHVHTDHVGWLTTRRGDAWVPTFPNARTVMPKLGYDWFTSGPGRVASNRDMFEDSILPVVSAGNVQFVPAEGGAVLDGISYHPTPGHSVDHMSILLQSDGHGAIFAGDVLHHRVQVAHPDLASMFCADPATARQSRLDTLALAARQRLLWLSSHFNAPSAGRVLQAEDGGFCWEAA